MTGRTLERQTLVTPLGVRFWDEVTRAVVNHGLRVQAWPVVAPMQRVDAFVSRSGVYVFAHLPGLRDAEFGAGDDAFWRDRTAHGMYRVEVTDRLGRFHPCTFDVDAPVRGLFVLSACVSPHEAPTAVPLFSTVARSAPAGVAVMRAQLVGPNNTPASWAIVEVRINGRRLGRGVADRQGRLLVMFEYPAPARSAASPPNGSPPGGSAPSSSPPASPPGSPPSGLATPARRYRTPPLELVAFAGTWPSGSPPASPPSATAPEIPDLCRVLQQPPSRLWLRLSPPEPLPPLELAFGDEALLKSAGRSDLLIAP